MFRPEWQLAPTVVSYDPWELDLMQAVFDEVWAMHDADFVDGEARLKAREALAQAILKDVAHGERDRAVLKSHALSEFLRYRNR
jgi:hypothetical protein